MAPQRQSRKRRKDETLAAALDIGASKVACFIARINNEPGLATQAEIVGVGCHGAPANARGPATPEAIETGVRNAVEAAERMAGEQVGRVLVAVPGKHVRGRRIGVDIELAGGVVAQEDVDDSLSEGAKIATPPDCAALVAMPIGFKVDGEDGISDPIGLSGSVLSTQMFAAGARRSFLDNLADLIERCDLKVEDFAAAPHAAAEAVLLDDEKELGVVLIDIGAGATGFAVYDNGALVECGGAPIGGGHITRDIAQIFGAPLAHAERVKTLYGSALVGPGDEHRFIDFPQLGVVGETARASRADISEVILPRLEEIFELVSQQLPDDGMRRSGLRRVVLTGGGDTRLAGSGFRAGLRRLRGAYSALRKFRAKRRKRSWRFKPISPCTEKIVRVRRRRSLAKSEILNRRVASVRQPKNRGLSDSEKREESRTR